MPGRVEVYSTAGAVCVIGGGPSLRPRQNPNVVKRCAHRLPMAASAAAYYFGAGSGLGGLSQAVFAKQTGV